jgi:hypothetical protein
MLIMLFQNIPNLASLFQQLNAILSSALNANHVSSVNASQTRGCCPCSPYPKHLDDVCRIISTYEVCFADVKKAE